MIVKLVVYVTKRRRQRLRLGGALVVPYERIGAGDDGELMMLARQAKDPHTGVDLLGGDSVWDFLVSIPPRPPVWKRRLWAWLRHVEGTLEYEPYKDWTKRPQNARYGYKADCV